MTLLILFYAPAMYQSLLMHLNFKGIETEPSAWLSTEPRDSLRHCKSYIPLLMYSIFDDSRAY